MDSCALITYLKVNKIYAGLHTTMFTPTYLDLQAFTFSYGLDHSITPATFH